MDMIEMIVVLNMNMIFYWFVVFPTLNAEKNGGIWLGISHHHTFFAFGAPYASLLHIPNLVSRTALPLNQGIV